MLKMIWKFANQHFQNRHLFKEPPFTQRHKCPLDSSVATALSRKGTSWIGLEEKSHRRTHTHTHTHLVLKGIWEPSCIANWQQKLGGVNSGWCDCVQLRLRLQKTGIVEPVWSGLHRPFDCHPGFGVPPRSA